MFLAVLNEALMISSAICVASGWYFIRRHNVRIHRRFMLWAAGLGLGFFLTYVLKTVVVGDTAFGGPAAYALPYLTFLQIHTVLATGAAVLGIITLRRALLGRFALHRKIAPWTASAWLITATTGLMVFLLLYVIFPPGPTSGNLIKVLFG